MTGSKALNQAVVDAIRVSVRRAAMEWKCASADLPWLDPEEEFDLEERDCEARTLLHWIARTGDAKSVTALLRAGVDPRTRDLGGSFPLLEAARSNPTLGVGVLKLLVAAASDMVNAKDDVEGTTPLIEAAKTGNHEAARILLGHGAHSSARDIGGSSAFGWAARRKDSDELIRMLRTNIEFDRADGAAAVVMAARVGNLALLNELIDRGAAVDGYDEEGVGALEAAAMQKRYDLAVRLMKLGAKSGPAGLVALLVMAVRRGNVDLVNRLVWRGAPVGDVDPVSGKRPLAAAVERGNAEIFDLLVRNGGDPLATLQDGLRAWDRKVVGGLVAKGYGIPLLVEAAAKGNRRTVRSFIEWGADAVESAVRLLAEGHEEAAILVTEVAGEIEAEATTDERSVRRVWR